MSRNLSSFFINRRSVSVLLAVASLGSSALAQTSAPYPNKPITWVVGFPPGGSVDVATRLVGQKLAVLIGQPIVVDNRAGASGLIGLQAAARAAPDGYTLVTVPGPIVTNRPTPLIGNELVGVAMLGKGATVLIGTKAEPLPEDVKSLIADAKTHPQKYNYASSGNGTGQHLAGALFNQMSGTTIMHIPYRGGSQAVKDVISGQVNLGVLGISTVLPHIRTGVLRAYAVATTTRSASLPDVPTMAEAGLAGIEAPQWFVVAAPAGVPADRLQKINEAIAEILKQPEVMDQFTKMGLEPAAASPQETTKFVSEDLKRWKDLAQKANLQLD